MHDIQSERDTRGIELDEVGISGVRYPVVFDDGQIRQQGIAEFAVSVRLDADRRGTHMSRMVALVHNELQRLDPLEIPRVLKEGAALMEAPAIRVEAALPFATEVTAPASGQVSWQVHELAFDGRLDETGVTVSTTVTTEVTSLCPCSKAISDYGAHNQRSCVTLAVEARDDNPYPLQVAAALEILRQAGSAPVIPLVKRSDERFLTMQAYDRPVFVEDMVRDISRACRDRGLRHTVRAKNLESIHSHDAFAVVSAS
jgi:GTP cyclohydrolase I